MLHQDRTGTLPRTGLNRVPAEIELFNVQQNDAELNGVAIPRVKRRPARAGGDHQQIPAMQRQRADVGQG